jgi:GTP-binding protein
MAGGKGGKGNVHFKTPTQQTPRYVQPGIPGEEGTVQLELKLMAEVGLVGFPNAGKSTLLATLSAAKPKIANYPFTTLTPQLGVVPYRKDNAFVMADIPGLIEGAAQGRGLGIQFLKHIERNLCLLFLIAADTENIPETYDVLQQELQNYNPALLQKPSLIVISKSDMLTEEDKNAVCQGFAPTLKPIFISALTNQGLEPLKDHIWHLLHHDG